MHVFILVADGTTVTECDLPVSSLHVSIGEGKNRVFVF